jgi:hypothetical protein
MANIFQSEPNKRILKFGLWLMRKKLGEQASAAAIHDDMQNCGNLGIKIINDTVIEASGYVKCDHQKGIMTTLTEFALWIVYKDTAYRDIFFWTLDKILQRAIEIRAAIKPFVKDPKDWHVNTWIDSKEITKQQIENGTILKGTVSTAESIHVPEMQRNVLTNISKQNIRR